MVQPECVSASVAQIAGSFEMLDTKVEKDYPTSIKELVEEGLSKVPESLVIPAPDRPPPSQPLKQGWEMPLIDISHLKGPGRKQTVDQIGLACQEWGFFQVINHGVQEPVIDGMWEAYNKLFNLPSHERAKLDALFVPKDLAKKLSQDKEKVRKLTTWRDTMRFRDFNPDDDIPQAPEFFRKPASEFYVSLRTVGEELLEAISESLGMEPDYIQNVTGNNPCVHTSIHYYAPCPNPDVTIGLIPHTDIDTLSVLLQDQTGGLQVLKEDRWVDVKTVPSSLVVNVGYAIQVITNGKYKSVLHRVMTNTTKARSSISCFLYPKSEVVIGPLPHLINEENAALYPNDTFGNHYYNYFARALKL